jgi:hypothetical protein
MLQGRIRTMAQNFHGRKNKKDKLKNMKHILSEKEYRCGRR